MRDNIFEECLSLQGQTSYLVMLLRCVTGSLNFMGSPCKYWLSFMAASIRKRCHSQPYGDVNKPFVQKGNAMGVFVAKVILMCCAIGLFITVEQPMNSWLHRFPPVVKAYAASGDLRAYVCMGQFGHKAAKPSELYGNGKWVTLLTGISAKKPVKKNQLKLAIRKGNHFNGNTAELTKSAAYTPEFCTTIVKLHGNEHLGPEEALEAEWQKSAL
jgi:hypothetical protein